MEGKNKSNIQYGEQEGGGIVLHLTYRIDACSQGQYQLNRQGFI